MITKEGNYMNSIKLDAAKKVAVALGKVRSKLKKDIEKEEAKLVSTEPVVYNGETYNTIEEAQDWYGCGGISQEDYEAIQAEFEKRQNATTPEVETMKAMKDWYDALITSMRCEIEKIENAPGE